MAWNRGPVKYQYVCRRCGEPIPFGDNGCELRHLAIYCKECAAKMLEVRERHAREAVSASVRTVRVKRCSYRTKEGMRVECYTEYRGMFPSLVISDK